MEQLKKFNKLLQSAETIKNHEKIFEYHLKLISKKIKKIKKKKKIKKIKENHNYHYQYLCSLLLNFISKDIINIISSYALDQKYILKYSIYQHKNRNKRLFNGKLVELTKSRVLIKNPKTNKILYKYLHKMDLLNVASTKYILYGNIIIYFAPMNIFSLRLDKYHYYTPISIYKVWNNNPPLMQIYDKKLFLMDKRAFESIRLYITIIDILTNIPLYTKILDKNIDENVYYFRAINNKIFIIFINGPQIKVKIYLIIIRDYKIIDLELTNSYDLPSNFAINNTRYRFLFYFCINKNNELFLLMEKIIKNDKRLYFHKFNANTGEFIRSHKCAVYRNFNINYYHTDNLHIDEMAILASEQDPLVSYNKNRRLLYFSPSLCM
jgi:hypothetical protein